MSDKAEARALALFSGGLDSILAARLVMEQGLAVSCLHFVSPFFGTPEKVPFWREAYGLEVRCIDIGEEYARLLSQGPEHGFGSVLNPCVDCKILMLRHAGQLLEREKALCVISGEVLGQRPMSQRRDTLNIIRRDAFLKGKLLRPLCALHLEPTEAEEAGLIDRSRLLDIAGRGRARQLELAERFGIRDFPQPSGGCCLAERERARSYLPVLLHCPDPLAADFRLANTGRQFWHDHDGEQAVYRLVIGRKKEDNERLMQLAADQDLLFKVRDYPGPLALGRFMGRSFSLEARHSAAALTASYCSRAVRQAGEAEKQRGGPVPEAAEITEVAAAGEVAVRVHLGSLDGPGETLMVKPERSPAFAWREFSWEEARQALKNKSAR